MTGFWAQRLAEMRGRKFTIADRAPVAPVYRPWWDQNPYQPQEQPQPQQLADQEIRIPKGLRSAHLTDRCPGCASQNYMAPPNTNARKRCYDCGFPIVQSGTDAGLPGDSSMPVQPARQIHDGTSNYNPSHIVARVG